MIHKLLSLPRLLIRRRHQVACQAPSIEPHQIRTSWSVLWGCEGDRKLRRSSPWLLHIVRLPNGKICTRSTTNVGDNYKNSGKEIPLVPLHSYPNAYVNSIISGKTHWAQLRRANTYLYANKDVILSLRFAGHRSLLNSHRDIPGPHTDTGYRQTQQTWLAETVELTESA